MCVHACVLASVCVECDGCQEVVVNVKDNKHAYTLPGLHNRHTESPSSSCTIAFLSVLLLFCPASFVMVFITVKNTKILLLSERRVIYSHLH